MRIGLCGTGGFAREVAPLALAMSGGESVCVIAAEPGAAEVNSLPVIRQDDTPIGETVPEGRTAAALADLNSPFAYDGEPLQPLALVAD